MYACICKCMCVYTISVDNMYIHKNIHNEALISSTLSVNNNNSSNNGDNKLRQQSEQAALVIHCFTMTRSDFGAKPPAKKDSEESTEAGRHATYVRQHAHT